MSAKVFIDGEAGTTGLQIRQRLDKRDDIELLHLSDDRRKDAAARAEMLNKADVAILCLPDEAAREAVGLIESNAVAVIDASNAHRTAQGWVYGMPEYEPGHAEKIKASKRITNPGCYACASVSILHPLIEKDLLSADFPATINAVSGYSGGGKKLIDGFENPKSENGVDSAFFVYGLSLAHKHVEEIRTHAGLNHRPVFVPSVGRFAQGMIVQVPLQLWSLDGKPTPADVHAALSEHYQGARFVEVAPMEGMESYQRLDPETLNGTNLLRLFVFAHEDNGQAVVAAMLDNLGKGASGQAVQNMNLVLGFPEETGLV